MMSKSLDRTLIKQHLCTQQIAASYTIEAYYQELCLGPCPPPRVLFTCTFGQA